MSQNKKLTENMKIAISAEKAVNILNDMTHKPEYACNSFFAIGHFDTENHVLDYLYHIMVCQFPGQDAYMNYCLSVTDETTKEYHQHSHTYKLDEITADTDKFCLITPKGEMSGTLDDLHLKCEIKDAALDLHLSAIGHPLYNAETGKFVLGGMEMYEYSIPRLLTNGTMRVGESTYEIKDGISWYDRQWEMKVPNIPKPIMNAAVKMMSKSADSMFPTWGWMDLNLDNGDVISTWFALKDGKEDCWATVMHLDGSHKMVRVSPMIRRAANHWTSEISRKSYPMTYYVDIPELDAKQTVQCAVENQELNFDDRPDLDHYEGAATVAGTYLG